MDNSNQPTRHQVRNAKRVLDSLDRLDERFQVHYSRQRKNERRHYRTLITIMVPHDESDGADLPCELGGFTFLKVFSRDLSPNGLSFIHPGEIKHDEIFVNLPNTETRCKAQIVRAREVLDGFWEYGVEFRQKLGRQSDS